MDGGEIYKGGKEHRWGGGTREGGWRGMGVTGLTGDVVGAGGHGWMEAMYGARVKITEKAAQGRGADDAKQSYRRSHHLFCSHKVSRANFVTEEY